MAFSEKIMRFHSKVVYYVEKKHLINNRNFLLNTNQITFSWWIFLKEKIKEVWNKNRFLFKEVFHNFYGHFSINWNAIILRIRVITPCYYFDKLIICAISYHFLSVHWYGTILQIDIFSSRRHNQIFSFSLCFEDAVFISK